MRSLRILSLTVILALGGCVSSPARTSADTADDPFESFNRTMFSFNQTLDKYVAAPVARGYKRVTPQPVRTGIGNFFSNLYQPTVIINDLLQGEFAQAGQDTLRFAVNTVFGFGGLIDIATPAGMPANHQDFGLTFAKWGIPDGPYLVLPVVGSSSVRDGIGLLPYYYATDPRGYVDDDAARYALYGVAAIDTRSRFLGIEKLLEVQSDPYTFSREAYRQRRRALLNSDRQTPESKQPLEDVKFD